ncbi:hypothetical protein EIN_150980 [Entamoeba invadens IP1]|uniref:C2 domain-containing protein n=1 Tax=Entamoeba invadens IP1 TaxID=370355 RepID=A0A0A1UEG9_ENTIV|nr:hypothetical protein EIN_150980 [Entamoeba invadens IP1]ELP91221.1 hypothetical protein EIN_150980 [Entamoeba invadens IP1]|eukprot:XP_004257992.1 hypothetical protein EIN_150980 [Entamoeba invadens IP1]
MAKIRSQIVLSQYGVAGEPCSGVVFMTVLAPSFVQRIFVELKQDDVKKTCDERNTFRHENDPELLTGGTKTQNTLINTFECSGFVPNVKTEYAFGTYSFSFMFTLPPSFPPSLIVPNKPFKSTYSLHPIVYESDGNRFEGTSCDFPVLYNYDVPEQVPVVVSKMLGKMVVTVAQNQMGYLQGDDMDVTLSILPNNSNVKEVTIALVGVYNEGSSCIKTVYNQANLKIDPINPTIGQSIMFPISYTTNPSFITFTQNYRHFISVKCIIQGILNSTAETCFPVKIIARKPHQEMIDVYANYLGVKICPNEVPTFCDGRMELPPQYPTTIKDGVEKVQTLDGRVLYLNHMNRTVSNVENGEPLIDTVYPLWKSVLLPPGITFGKHKNKECVFDHINKKVIWNSMFDITPQALLSDITNPCVSIFVLEAAGLKCRNASSPPAVYAAVVGGDGKMTKSKEIKSTEPIFQNVEFNVVPEKNRRNVVVYLYDKRSLLSDELIGSVDIDLSKLPFPSFIESWFEITNSPFGDEAFTGKVKLKIGYDRYPHRITDDCKTIVEFNSACFIPYYPPTENMVKQAEMQMAYHKKNLTEPYIISSNGTVVNTTFDLSRVIN